MGSQWPREKGTSITCGAGFLCLPRAWRSIAPVALTAAQVGAKQTGGEDLVNQPVFSECFKLIPPLLEGGP